MFWITNMNNYYLFYGKIAIWKCSFQVIYMINIVLLLYFCWQPIKGINTSTNWRENTMLSCQWLEKRFVCLIKIQINYKLKKIYWWYSYLHDNNYTSKLFLINFAQSFRVVSPCWPLILWCGYAVSLARSTRQE